MSKPAPHSFARQNQLLHQGITRFNAGEYFAAHESWEQLWYPLPESPLRQSVQILIQMAVTLELARRSVPAGVVRQHSRYSRRLAALPPVGFDVDLAALAAAMDHALQPFLTTGPDSARGTIYLDESRAPKIILGYNGPIAP